MTPNARRPPCLHPSTPARFPWRIRRPGSPTPWPPTTGVNLKFRVMRGTVADFHVHADGPECFFVLSGIVTIDTDGASVTLEPGQFLEVPAGVRHRSRVEGEATVLVFDGLAA